MNEPKSMEKALASFDALNDASSRVHEGDFVFTRINLIWKIKNGENLFHRELQTICQESPVFKEETSPSPDLVAELNGMFHMLATNLADKNGTELVFTAPAEVIDRFKDDKYEEARSCRHSVPFFRDRGGSQFTFKQGDEVPPSEFSAGSIFAIKKERSWRDQLAQIIMSDFAKLIIQTQTKLLTSVDIDRIIDFRIQMYDPVKHFMIEDYRELFCNVNVF